MTTTIFEKLSAIDVGKHIEKKGKHSYLSWSYAVAYLRKHAPDASWEVVKSPLPDAPHVLAPYCITPAGAFVEVAVTVGGVRLSQVHPVIDERNTTIKTPNAYDVNKALMRCLVKAIALHGLGLDVYAGEDLPMGDLLEKEEKEEATKKAEPPKAGPKKVESPPPRGQGDEAARIKAAREAIAAQAKRLGIADLSAAKTDDEKAKASSAIANELRKINGGTLPATADDYEDALAVMKESSPKQAA